MDYRLESYLDKLDRAFPTRYPDSAAGALLCLQHESTLRTADAELHADPRVPGMWMVVLPKEARLHVLVDTVRGDFEEVTIEPKDCPCTFCAFQLSEEQCNASEE